MMAKSLVIGRFTNHYTPQGLSSNQDNDTEQLKVAKSRFNEGFYWVSLKLTIGDWAGVKQTLNSFNENVSN